jgi:Protein of unknown function (DUF2631)
VNEAGGTNVAEHEPVLAPDQRKPGARKAGQIGAVVTALILIAMLFRNNEVSGVEKIWIIGIAVFLIGAVAVDAVLRRNGLR